jgi:hypothetical protein
MMDFLVEMKCRCLDYSPMLRQLKMTWTNTSQQQQHLVTALFSQTINRKRDFTNSYPPSDRSAYAERARKTFKSVIRFATPALCLWPRPPFPSNSSRLVEEQPRISRLSFRSTNHKTHFSEPRPKSFFIIAMGVAATTVGVISISLVCWMTWAIT